MENKKDDKLVEKPFIDKPGFSNTGSRYFTPIEYKYDEEAKCFVPYQGKPLDRFKMIQASKPSVDINYIVKRAAAGDIGAINVNQGTYADVSNVPTDLNTMHAANIEAINSFYKLDPNLRKLFNNDVDVFAEAISNGTYLETIKNAMSVEESKNDVSNESEVK